MGYYHGDIQRRIRRVAVLLWAGHLEIFGTPAHSALDERKSEEVSLMLLEAVRLLREGDVISARPLVMSALKRIGGERMKGAPLLWECRQLTMEEMRIRVSLIADHVRNIECGAFGLPGANVRAFEIARAKALLDLAATVFRDHSTYPERAFSAMDQAKEILHQLGKDSIANRIGDLVIWYESTTPAWIRDPHAWSL